MSHVELILPNRVHQAVRRLAKRQGIAPDKLMVQALAETVAADKALQELRLRAKKGVDQAFPPNDGKGSQYPRNAKG